MGAGHLGQKHSRKRKGHMQRPLGGTRPGMLEKLYQHTIQSSKLFPSGEGEILLLFQFTDGQTVARGSKELALGYIEAESAF